MPDNPLHQQWTLVGALFTATVACLSALWFVFQQKTEQTRTAVLEIRAALSQLFQQTVAEEALRIFRHVEDRLPTALSQADADSPDVTAFDRLCVGLRTLDPHDPNRRTYDTILKQLISDKISQEARRIVSSANERIPFAFETERKLAFLARKTVEAVNFERGYNEARKWLFRTIVSAPCCAFIVLISVLYPFRVLYFIGSITVVLWGLVVVLYIVALVIQLKCHNWLLDASKKDALNNAWHAELQRGDL